MYTGINELYKYRKSYCLLVVMYSEYKWWQFLKKRNVKDMLDWYYPLMKSEVKVDQNL